MASDLVLAGNALAGQLRRDFIATYKEVYRGSRERLNMVANVKIPSERLQEFFGYFEASPYPVRWPRGEKIAEKGFQSVQYSVTNFRWGRRVKWDADDRADDVLKDLFAQAKGVGQNWALLDELLFFQILTANTADNDLLPSIPNAPDGAALHSATDGNGDDRFQISGGNIITGSGVLTGEAISDDFFSGTTRIGAFLNTEGKPLWARPILDMGFVCIFNQNNLKQFQEAFRQGRTVNIIQNVAAAENVAAAAVTNLILDSGQDITLWPTTFITDDDWFIFVKGNKIKPIFTTEREGLTEKIATMDNSDSARDTNEEYIQWKSRGTGGVNLSYGTLKVNN